MKLHIAGMALGALLMAAPAAHANLLVNGDFGTGDLTGWSETNSCCYYVGTPGDNSYFNGQGFHEGAVGTNGMLEQTFSDIAGETLKVTFDYASDGGAGTAYQYISFDGNTVAGTLISGAAGYAFYSFTLGVGTGLDTITFNGRNDPDYDWLSNVNVSAVGVPEPGSLALLGAGLAGFGALRRRRKTNKAA